MEPRLSISTELLVLLLDLFNCLKVTSAPVAVALEFSFRDLSRLELLYVSMAELTALCTKTRRTGMDTATMVIDESAADQMTDLYASSVTLQFCHLETDIKSLQDKSCVASSSTYLERMMDPTAVLYSHQ